MKGKQIRAMKMIIGGAHQGKYDYAKKKYPELHWIDGENCTEQDLFCAEGICNFHLYIERMMRENKDVSKIAKKLIQENPNIVIISDEIGYGIVPADVFLRRYREMTGRICTELASYSEEVYRVACGIGLRIK